MFPERCHSLLNSHEGLWIGLMSIHISINNYHLYLESPEGLVSATLYTPWYRGDKIKNTNEKLLYANCKIHTKIMFKHNIHLLCIIQVGSQKYFS